MPSVPVSCHESSQLENSREGGLSSIAKGSICRSALRPRMLRVLPAMNITREQIDEGLEILGRALADVTREAVTS